MKAGAKLCWLWHLTSPYIFSIITKDQADSSWEPGNEGWVLARKLSALTLETLQ